MCAIFASMGSAARTVDDTPSGGGPGMVMRADVACAAIDAVVAQAIPIACVFSLRAVRR